MLSEFEKSIKSTLYDRLSSPLIGSYVTAWCLVNYKIFLIVFSDMSYPQKVQYLDAFFSTWWLYIVRYGVPALCTLAYIDIYPSVAKGVFEIWQKYIKEKKEIKNKIEGQILLTKEESAKIREEFLRRRIELNSLLEEKNKEIDELKEENRMLREKLNIQPLSFNGLELESELSAGAKDILSQIVDSGAVSFNLLQTNKRNLLIVGEKQIQLDDKWQMYLDELIENGFIRDAGKDSFVLQKKGIDYIKNLKKP